jgi:hypothetical protein
MTSMPNITISSPANPPTPVTVDTSFQTWGTVSPQGTTMKAWVQLGNHSTDGTAVNPPVEGSDWTFQFSNLLAGKAYTLNVGAVGKEQGVKQVSITT